ncbi:MAG: ornithine carbamoyltransferase [Desulfovibrionaceae bacterium]|nr:ornithine carbamoyltransferase [Desulfovibrionaceae bacterium]MBF0514668.1 ornithine carbamoyltransferase [Desulfovibrionaceae bacterium]
MAKRLLTTLNLSYSEAWGLLFRAAEIKNANYTSDLLAGKTIVMIFEKASTRTRVSFEIAVNQMGGKTLLMTRHDSQLGRHEPIADTARVLSRYADGLIVRTYAHSTLDFLAAYSDIPVINALSDDFHPCQILSDMLTITERTPDLEKVRIAWVGDGNNVAHSLMQAAIYFPFELFMTFPKGYEPNTDIIGNCLSLGAKIYMTYDPEEGVEDAHYVYTDVWASMGQEDEQEKRAEIFAPYQVNEELLAGAHPDCKVMHCLPAHRGEEITDEVIEGPRSIVWDQAENRLHMQKAILEWVYGNHDYHQYTVTTKHGKHQAFPHAPF